MDGTNRFRILDLLPGDDGDHIQCTLRNATLDTPPPQYEALSYVWGARINLKSITVSGEEVKITESLYDGLRRLRYKYSARSLWIDQLCINQSNPEEKTQQIKMMRSIYKSCGRCVIWMGEVPGEIGRIEAEAAVEFIRLCAQGLVHEEFTPPGDYEFDRFVEAQNGLKTLGLNGNPWWSRIWTVQEAILPPEAVLVWGQLQIPWETILYAIRSIFEFRQGFRSSQILNNPTEVVLDAIDTFVGDIGSQALFLKSPGQADQSPLGILQMWRSRGASDPKDKVFALMGLFGSAPLPNLQSCDYNTPVSALYTEVTLDQLQLEGGLRALIGHRPSLDGGSDIPSWALSLDWVQWSRWDSVLWDNHSKQYEWYSACKGMSRFQFTTQPNRSVLVLNGIFVDRVQTIGTCFPYWTASHEQIAKSITIWKETMESAHQRNGFTHNYYPNGYDPELAFWKTMMRDLILEESVYSRRASEEDCRLLAEFCRAWEIPQNKSILPRITLSYLARQRFFVTEKGYIGIGPGGIEEGDEVWVLSGGNSPFVLRPRNIAGTKSVRFEENETAAFTMRGDSFVYGLMDGEASRLLSERETMLHIY